MLMTTNQDKRMRMRFKVGRAVVCVLMLMLLVGAGALEARSSKIPRTGIGLRASAFGIPNQILDLFVYEHPRIQGTAYTFEIRTFGSKGPKSTFSGVYALEYSKMDGKGPWRDEQEHRRLDGEGEVTQANFTATILMSLFPRSPIHPYIGAGIGVGKISIWYEGIYYDELGTEIKESYKKDYIIPVAHVPIGIMFNIKNNLELRLEGGFKNGFYIGGAVSYLF